MAQSVTIIFAAVAVAAFWGLAMMSLLTLSGAPVYRLWIPAVAATEWGHWLAVIAIALAAARMFGAGLHWSIIPAVFAAVLFLSPTVRAIGLARGLSQRMNLAFGPPASDRIELEGYERRSRFVPLSVARLIHIPIPTVECTRMVYREEDGVRLALDLYRPRGETKFHVRGTGVILVIHGGSWNSGDKSQLSGTSRYLAARGHTVAAINYRLAPRFRYPAPLEDICRAIDFIRVAAPRHGFNADHIAMLGRSSGGHLALSAAYDRKWPSAAIVRGVIALYAPTDFVWSWARPSPRRLSDSNGVIRQFLGGTPDQIPDVFDRASPIRHVSSESPPTLLIHGAIDELVSPLQSTRLATALEGVGTPHLHVELPWGHHGMDANMAGPSGQITLYLIERFLESVFPADDVPE